MHFPVTSFRLSALMLLGGLVLNATPARADEDKSDDKKITHVAHIKLSGDLDEKPPADNPFGGVLGESLHTKIERLRKARADKDIKALLLEIDGLAIGWGKIEELSKAIAHFRSGGKKVYAYLEGGSAKDYAVGLACDEVCIPEAGWLMLTGMRMEVSFYKDLFEKIGVKADMLQMGEFKGAAEPFTRTSLSEPNKKQLNSILDDLYDNGLVATIVKGRASKKFDAQQVKKLIDRGPYAARAALKQGLVDRVTYPEALEKIIKEELKAEEIKIARNYGQKKAEDIDFSSPFAILKLLSPVKITSSGKPKIAVIYATGPITTGKGGGSLFGADSVGSETMVKAIQQAENDKTVKAIVLRVDSPGGSALASDLIWNEIVKSKKPVVASMSDVAASGGYYISMGARKIYAEPGTITGSIGVVGGKLATGGMWEKIGIKTEVLARGEHSGILSGTEPFTDSERETMRDLMKDVYDLFLTKTLVGREKAGKKLTRAELEKLAGGRVWTGRQAKENGLIDELGTLEDAIKEAKKMAGIPADKEMELLQLPKAKGFLDALLDSKTEMRFSGVDLRMTELVPGLKAKLRPAAGLLQLRGDPVWAVLPYQIEVK
jgi:protease-4